MSFVESLRRFAAKILKRDPNHCDVKTDRSGEVIIRSDSAAEKIKNSSLELHHNDWISLNHMSSPKDKIYNYIYSTETKCNGKIAAFIPYQKHGETLKLLVRCEAVPCWNFNEPVPSSFSGCVEKGETPLETVIHELKEEGGYEVESSQVINLGQVFGTKSTDTIYFLFAVDLTDCGCPDKLTYESELEKSSYNVWVDARDSFEISDSLFNCIGYRLLNFLNMAKV